MPSNSRINEYVIASKSQRHNNKTIELLPSLPKTAKSVNDTKRHQLRQKKTPFTHTACPTLSPQTITLEGVYAEHFMNYTLGQI